MDHEKFGELVAELISVEPTLGRLLDSAVTMVELFKPITAVLTERRDKAIAEGRPESEHPEIAEYCQHIRKSLEMYEAYMRAFITIYCDQQPGV